jgi:7-cyano-7-deazaguanine reductase
MTERIYMDIQRAVSLRKLMVICLYTRRGGIDINPVRASHRHLIPEVFKQSELLNEKTSRQ